MKSFTIVVDENEINIIGQILAEAPYKVAAPLIAKLQAQVNEQQTKPTEEVQP